MRLHRERRRKGLRCLTIELRETEIDALARMGLLRPEMRNNANAVIQALYMHFDRTLDFMPWRATKYDLGRDAERTTTDQTANDRQRIRPAPPTGYATSRNTGARVH